MKNSKNQRNGFSHLYNPEEEGLGTYDIHYINAYRKNKILKAIKKEKDLRRYAA